MSKVSETNDFLRKCLPMLPPPHRLIITSAVAELGIPCQKELFEKIKQFDSFTPDNDPYGEHDAGMIEHDGEDFYWKFDYLDDDLESYKPDGIRFLTVMLMREY